jgi:hypothetical protein
MRNHHLIEKAIRDEVLTLVMEEAVKLAPSARDTDECIAFVHVVVRNCHIHYGAMPLSNGEFAVSAQRQGLSAKPLQL